MRFLKLSLVVLTLAACSGQTPAATPSTVDSGPKAGPNCVDTTRDARHLSFGPSGLVGIMQGAGKTGIVLAHQSGGSVCQWLPTIRELTGKGYLVLAFDFSSYGGSSSGSPGLADDVTQAVKAIRAAGATKVVVIGASMGGTAAIAAAATITPPVDAVVALSAPTAFNGADAVSVAGRLTMPALYAAGANETVYARAAEQMSQANPKAELLLAKGTAQHGVSLILPDAGSPDATDGMAAFLTKHAPPG